MEAYHLPVVLGLVQLKEEVVRNDLFVREMIRNSALKRKVQKIIMPVSHDRS